MEDLDFYGEKELKRNRRFILIGSSIFLALVVAFIFVAAVFSDLIIKTNDKVKNASGELEAKNLKFKGVQLDLQEIAKELSELGPSDWQTSQMEQDSSCTYGDFGLKEISIICNIAIESEIPVDSQDQLNKLIDAYRNELISGTYFTDSKSTSSSLYPSLVPVEAQKDLDKTVLSALASKDQLSYGRWGVEYCDLFFTQVKNNVDDSSVVSTNFLVSGKLECSDNIKLNRNGNNLR